MNVTTITMDPAAARAKLQAYQHQLHRRTDAEYEAAVLGYQALAAGTPLLNLEDVFAASGLGEDGRPRLAVARADRKQIMFRAASGQLWFNALKRPGDGWYGEYEGSLNIGIPFQFPANTRTPDGYALIPMVPADVRPAKGQLSEFFILWEVEQWAERRIRSTPDRDPYLLRHIIGNLYAVVAEWDLTDLERAIMTGRRETA